MFRRLEWQRHEEINGFYSEPYALKWSYSIYIDKQDRVKLELLDPFYEYVPEFTQVCETVDEAKISAQNHYFSILEKLIGD